MCHVCFSSTPIWHQSSIFWLSQRAVWWDWRCAYDTYRVSYLEYLHSGHRRLTPCSTSIDSPYPVYGGIYRDEAIMLLRRFYVQENEKAPEPKQKKNRELKTEILPFEIEKFRPSPAP